MIFISVRPAWEIMSTSDDPSTPVRTWWASPTTEEERQGWDDGRLGLTWCRSPWSRLTRVSSTAWLSSDTTSRSVFPARREREPHCDDVSRVWMMLRCTEESRHHLPPQPSHPPFPQSAPPRPLLQRASPSPSHHRQASLTPSTRSTRSSQTPTVSARSQTTSRGLDSPESANHDHWLWPGRTGWCLR